MNDAINKEIEREAIICRNKLLLIEANLKVLRELTDFEAKLDELFKKAMEGKDGTPET